MRNYKIKYISNLFSDNLLINYKSLYKHVVKNRSFSLSMYNATIIMRLEDMDNMCMSYCYLLLFWSNGDGIMCDFVGKDVICVQSG